MIRSACLARVGLLVAVMAGVLLGGPAPASAGQFHAYFCQTPAGHSVAVPHLTRLDSGNSYTTSDTCATGGVLAVGLGSVAREAGEYTALELRAPSGFTIAQLELRRRVLLNEGEDEFLATVGYGLSREGPVTLDTCSLDTGSCGGMQSWATSSFSFSTPATRLMWSVACDGVGYCGDQFQEKDRIRQETSMIHLLVNESSQPTGSAGGAITNTSITHSGTVNATVQGQDVGAGFYEAFARIDGAEAGRVNVGGNCSDRGNHPSSDLDFESFQPCPASTSLTLPVNTRVVADGTARNLRIFVRDAAGNETLVSDQSIRIQNGIASTSTPTPAPTVSPTVAPPATPTPGASDPTPPASVPTPGPGTPQGPVAGRLALAGKKLSQTVRARKAVKLSGTVVRADGGGALAGAEVTVSERVGVSGAGWSDVARIKTDAKGAFSYAPTTSASRTLRFSYAFGPGGSLAASQTYELKVTAAISIRSGASAVRRTGTVKLSGTVSLAHLPAKGATLDIQVLSGGRWQSIDRTKVSRSGRWAWTYKLRQAKHRSYRFRAYLRAAADVPAEPSASPVVTVRVQR